MARTAIKAWNGWIIGWEDDSALSSNGKSGYKTTCNFSGLIVAKYWPQYDYTTDFSGRQVGKGDQRMGLLYEDIYKRNNPTEIAAIKH